MEAVRASETTKPSHKLKKLWSPKFRNIRNARKRVLVLAAAAGLSTRATMAERRKLRNDLIQLRILVDGLPEDVVEYPKSIKAWFTHLLEYAAETRLHESLTHPTVWEHVHSRLVILEGSGLQWTACGKVGLNGMLVALDHYGYGYEGGNEIEIQSWCDKITVAVER